MKIEYTNLIEFNPIYSPLIYHKIRGVRDDPSFPDVFLECSTGIERSTTCVAAVLPVGNLQPVPNPGQVRCRSNLVPRTWVDMQKTS